MSEDLSRCQHPRFARLYVRTSADSERRGTAAHRDRLLADLTGRVLEVGAGNGLNFSHYPPTVTEVVAVEPEDQLRALAEQAATTAPVPVQVVAAQADSLPFDDGAFDAAVASLVLCSVPDPAHSLAELRRVLAAGGDLRFFEHVRSTHRALSLAQDLIAPLWAAGAGGCHLNRDTAATIRSAGFTIDELDRFTYRPLRFVPAHAHILGRAHTPAGQDR
ncbi:class I SAM-dependent methyltransferase [Pseudofrankia sp. DC12]|uniref:class I SAM-dependent methyltransferase n=1 Tax=Pseudofrankia sp. DC12 TaxID=683315 RepID=UPI0005F8944A|nr:class I SAM-dependent methyltransferase [Pseudofrankia sp. DC12]